MLTLFGIILAALLLVALYPLGLAVELSWENNKRELAVYWLPLIPGRRRVRLKDNWLRGGDKLPAWEVIREMRGPLDSLLAAIHLHRFDCRGEVCSDWAGDAGSTALVCGLALAVGNSLLGPILSRLGSAPGPEQRRLAILLGQEERIALEVELYLSLGAALLHIWRLRRAYYSIMNNMNNKR